jgi:hypothetical protein
METAVTNICTVLYKDGMELGSVTVQVGKKEISEEECESE